MCIWQPAQRYSTIYINKINHTVGIQPASRLYCEELTHFCRLHHLPNRWQGQNSVSAVTEVCSRSEQLCEECQIWGLHFHRLGSAILLRVFQKVFVAGDYVCACMHVCIRISLYFLCIYMYVCMYNILMFICMPRPQGLYQYENFWCK